MPETRELVFSTALDDRTVAWFRVQHDTTPADISDWVLRLRRGTYQAFGPSPVQNWLWAVVDHG